MKKKSQTRVKKSQISQSLKVGQTSEKEFTFWLENVTESEKLVKNTYKRIVTKSYKLVKKSGKKWIISKK